MKNTIKIGLVFGLALVAILLLLGLRWLILATYSELQPAKDIADFLLKIFSGLAVLIGGAWGFYKYIIGGTTSWMNNISLDTSVLPYRDQLGLLVIHVRSTNPRTSKFEFDESNATFKLEIRLLPDNKDARTVFSEEEGLPIASIDLLEGSGGYEMLPSATVDDMRTVVLPLGALASMTAELRIRRWWQVEDDFISISSVVRVEP